MRLAGAIGKAAYRATPTIGNVHPDKGRTRYRTRKKCGVERVDRGDGSFTERDKICTRSRTEYKTDTYCNYTVDRWQSLPPLKVSGGPQQALIWPDFRAAITTGLGAQREVSRNQTLSVIFTDQASPKTT